MMCEAWGLRYVLYVECRRCLGRKAGGVRCWRREVCDSWRKAGGVKRVRCAKLLD